MTTFQRHDLARAIWQQQLALADTGLEQLRRSIVCGEWDDELWYAAELACARVRDQLASEPVPELDRIARSARPGA